MQLMEQNLMDIKLKDTHSPCALKFTRLQFITTRQFHRAFVLWQEEKKTFAQLYKR